MEVDPFPHGDGSAPFTDLITSYYVATLSISVSELQYPKSAY